jgi:threonine dehydratase
MDGRHRAHSRDAGRNAAGDADVIAQLPSLAEIESAASIVYRSMPPTPQYRWPLLEERAGRQLWVKHENHTPVGAFKVRGGLAYFDELKKKPNAPQHVICATRGNHGQSIAFAARQHGIAATIVVPQNNSSEKNDAMRGLGAHLIEYGDDFQESFEYALRLAQERSLHLVPSFHPTLVRGVATYALELLRNVANLDALYVPIGLGSGITGAFAARDALRLKTEIIAVVAQNAPAIALSLERGALVSAPANTMADGMACRTPNSDAFAILKERQVRVVCVSDEQITEAIRLYFTATHNVAEGAGAAALAAALDDPQRERYRSVAVVLSGGNIDAAEFTALMSARSNAAG